LKNMASGIFYRTKSTGWFALFYGDILIFMGFFKENVFRPD